jgi:peroxiredoxin
MSLAVGATFPVDVAVDSTRGPVRLSDMIGAGPTVVAFHRLWCPFCQQAARELAAVKDQLDALGARVVIVYRQEVDFVHRACNRRGIPFDCLSDPRRELETAANIERFSIGRYAAFSPRRLVAALRSGSRMGKVTSGLLQGRSTFVLDSSGRIVYAHRSLDAADIAPIGDVVAAVESAAGTLLSSNLATRHKKVGETS